MLPRVGALTLATLALVPALTLSAADRFWSGGTGSYNNPAAWGGTVPGLGDVAINDSGAANAVQINLGDPDWILNGIFAGRSLGDGSFVQNGQTVYITNAVGRGAVRLGVAPGRSGNYTINGGNLNYTGEFNIGELGSASLTVNGGTISGSGNLAITIGNSLDTISATMAGTNKGDYTWFEQGFYQAEPTRGIPPAGSQLVSETLPDHVFTMPASYSAPNAFQVFNGINNATITFNSPTAASAISFLGSAGLGDTTVGYTIHFADTTTESGTILIRDWFSNDGSVAHRAGGRISANGLNLAIINDGPNKPYLMSFDIAVANTAIPITKVDLSYVSGGVASVLAVSASTGGNFTPVAVSGFNQDIVVESNAQMYIADNITNVLNQVAGSINVTGEVFVGNRGAGVYNMSGGTNNFANWFVLGRSGGHGRMTMTGGQIDKTGSGNIALGTAHQNYPGGTPSAVFYHSGGVINSSGEFMIPENSPASGEYNISGTAVLNVNNWMQVGRSGGTGLMNMTGGTVTKTGGGNFIVGDNATGVLNQSAGSINVNNEAWVGQGGSGNGTYNLSGGSITVANWIAIGRAGGMGVVNFTNGVINKIGGGNFAIGSGGNGTLNQYGGYITNQVGFTYVAEAGGVGTWNMYGGTATLGILQFCQGGNGNGLMYFNGGILNVNEINCGVANANGAIFLNGGTIRANGDNANFFHSLGSAYVDVGGVVIDSQEFDITVAQTLIDYGGGGLTKLGSGTLTLTGYNNYSGATTISAGKLAVTTDSQASSTGGYTVANGATWAVKVQYAGAQLYTASATFNSGNTTLEMDLGNFGNPTVAPISLFGNLAVNGTVTINLDHNTAQLGQFPLIQYTSRTGSGNFVIGSLPNGVVATVVTNVVNNSIDINITSVNLPRWDGQDGGTWDVGVTENWINIGNGLPIVFSQGNAVLFDDQAQGTTSPNLVTTVTPSSVTFNNDALNYTLTGSGKISGSTGLTKQGVATTTIANTGGNDYTGPTVIAGGTLSVSSLANGGSASAIGASSADPANLVISGGTLDYTGPATAINRGYSVGGTNSAISVNNNLTLSGAVTAAQNANFVKFGLGQLAYTGSGSNLLTGTGSSGYWVQDGSVRFEGVSGAQTNVIPGGLSINGTTTTASVVLTNTTVISGGNVDLGNVPFTTSSLTVNSNSTLNVGSWFIQGDAGDNTSTVNLNGGTINNLNGALLMGGRPNTVNILNINGGTLNRAGDNFIIGPGQWNGEGYRTGIVNQVAGTVNSTREIWVGQSYIGYGEYHLSGGVINQSNWMSIGREGATGILNMTGGELYRRQDGTAFIVADRDASIGTFNQSGGIFDSTKEFWVGHGRHGERGPSIGVYNLSAGSASVHDWVAIGREGGNGTFNMTGGTFFKDGNGDFLVADGNGSVGTLNHSGGTITSTKSFLVPQDGDLTTLGTYNVSGSAVLTLGSWFAVGRNGGVGVMNMTNGLVAKIADPGAAFIIGASGPGTFNQYGGTVSNTVSATWIGEDNSATWNMEDGLAQLAFLQVARNGASIAVINQNGGVIEATEIAGGSGNATINFNGGTIRATASPTNFLYNLDAANILAGGLTLDTGDNAVEVGQSLLNGGGNGGLIKTGTGTLRLNGVNTYTGATVVNAGALGGVGTIAGPVNVASGAGLAPGGAATLGTLTINNTLTLAVGSTTTVKVSLDNGPESDLVTGVTSVTYNGALVVQAVGDAPLVAGSVFQVFNVSGTKSGNFTSVTVLPYGAGTFNPATGEVTITVGAPPVVNPPYTSGGNIVLTGTGGSPNGSYSWLTSTNVTAPVSEWTTNSTGVFSETGSFSNAIPVNPSEPARFFRLKTP